MNVQISDGERLALQAADLLGNFNDELLELESWLDAIDPPDRDDPPKWVFALRRLYDRLDASAEALEVMLRQRVFPQIKEDAHVQPD